MPRPLYAIIAVGFTGLAALMNWPSARITFVGGASLPSWTADPVSTPVGSAGREITGQAQVRDGDTIVVAGVPVGLRAALAGAGQIGGRTGAPRDGPAGPELAGCLPPKLRADL